MHLTTLFPDKNLPMDAKSKHWGKLIFSNGSQALKPMLGIGAVTTVFELYKTDPLAAATFASIGLLSYWTVNMLKTDFAKNMLAQTKLSEWDAVTYSKKHFQDQAWNRRYHPSVGPALSAANMYNHFVVKHNTVLDFAKFDTLVNFGVKAAIHLSRMHDNLFVRFQAASKELGLWNKFQRFLDPIRSVVVENKTTFNIFEQVKEIAPHIEGFMKDKNAGPRDDIYRYNDELISTASEKYVLNNSYFSFATLHAEIIHALTNNDAKTIKELSGHRGIGKFINLCKYTGNSDFKPLHEMATQLLSVMDNYQPNDTYYFGLAHNYDPNKDIKANAEAIFDNFKDMMKSEQDIEISKPVKLPEEMFRQMQPTMERFLVKQAIDQTNKSASPLTAEKMENDIFPKTQRAAKKFIDKVQEKFSVDISPE